MTEVASDVDLLVEFLNSFEGESDGGDSFADATRCARWMRAHGLDPGGTDAARARAVREALREAAGGAGPTPLDGVALRVVVDDEGRPVLVASDPVARMAAIAVQLAVRGDWQRMKLCHATTCRWAFYDASRNRSGRWCSMAGCGNRAKTRAFRERQRSG